MSKPFPQLLLLGDSLIQFSSHLSNGGYHFSAALQEHCDRRLEVVNRGLSGYNTENILKILPELIPSPFAAKVEYLLVLFGANDACLPGSPSKQHVPLEKYRENIKTILTHPSITGHNPTILLVTPPPVNEFHLDESAIANGSDATRRQATTAQYAIAIREIANEFKDRKVKLVDLWSAILNEAAGSDHISPAELGHFEGPPILGSKEKGECKGLRKLLVDGLHFTGEGYRVFSKEVIPLVGPTWTQEPLTAPVTWVFPHWSIAPKIE